MEMTEAMRALDEIEMLIKDGNVNEDAWDYCRALTLLATLRAALAPGADGEVEAPSDYDAGLLGDWGGGNVDWWHDYLRAEIGRANEHWQAQYDALAAELAAERERRLEVEGALKLGKIVMGLLQEHGPSIVPHLLDTDENAGQRFRDALERAATLTKD